LPENPAAPLPQGVRKCFCEVTDLPSAKILEQKQQFVKELSEKIRGSVTGVLVEYKGLTVAQDRELRAKLRESGATYAVIKNSLLSRAFKEAGYDGMDDTFVGTTAIALSAEEMAAPAKALSEFAKKNKFFKIKAGFVDGNALDAAGVERLASLPSKEVLIAQVLGGLNAPISGLVTVLNGNIRGLAVALNAIKEQKEKQSA
jgi:large subunit ribosomal protein L10